MRGASTGAGPPPPPKTVRMRRRKDAETCCRHAVARRARRRARRAGALAVLALALLGAQPALAAAPDPGGDENARISLPVPGKEFGFNGLFNVDSFFNDALDPSQQGALIATAGGD